MKKLLLGAALCFVAAACTSSKTSSVEDAKEPAVKSECCTSGKTDCSGKACTGEKAECSGKVCPVTGKTMN